MFTIVKYIQLALLQSALYINQSMACLLALTIMPFGALFYSAVFSFNHSVCHKIFQLLFSHHMAGKAGWWLIFLPCLFLITPFHLISFLSHRFVYFTKESHIV